MATYVSDQEQLEVLKAWWKKNGKALIAVILLGIILAFAVRYWQNQRYVKYEEASVLYEQMLTSFAHREIPAFNQYVERLRDKYGKTPYGAAAVLLSAKQLVQENKLDQALQSLNWVADHAKDKNLKDLANIRAARILLVQQKYDLALDHLKAVTHPTFAPLASMVRGDIYLAQSKYDLAKESYQSALSGLPETEAIVPFLKMKLERVNLGRS